MTGVAALTVLLFVMLMVAQPEPDTTPRGAPMAPAVTSSSATPSPRDQYIEFLDTSGQFPDNVTTDARGLWLRTGLRACDHLRRTYGDVGRTTLAVAESLVDYSGKGWNESGLGNRAVIVVAAASHHLCPGVATE
ncbi:DUF732 domain-containing protein [Longimycelium tulufanense]|uniref:DUF732 domain-containing protein n=1 Tax=Longimycelium tulufanense TaxID=907463 RepID=UPI001E3EE5F8|nr:DUF732 domain-containing protein [Longimycelium tulufanense]